MASRVDPGEVPRRLVHLQRLEDGLPAVVREGGSRDRFNQVTRQPVGDPAVVPLLARLPRVIVLGRSIEAPAGNQVLAEPFAEWHARVAATVLLGIGRPVPYRRGVGEQVAERDRLARVRRIADRKRQVAADVVLELETALLPELHERRGGDGLRDRPDVLQRVERHRFALVEVCEAVGRRPDDGASLENAGGDTRDMVRLHPAPDERVDLRPVGAPRPRACQRAGETGGGPRQKRASIEPPAHRDISRGGYSHRSAMSGSTRLARRAGR